MDNRTIIGRFAPSPSGRIHLGNVFSSLIAWLSVRKSNGIIVLRLEDLDTQRCKREYCDLLEQDYKWLGLDWDLGGSMGGDCYYQSKRTEIYQQYFETLQNITKIYPCFCTRNELHSASAPHRSDNIQIYSGACRNLSYDAVQQKLKLRKPAMRIEVPNKNIAFTDNICGNITQNLQSDCGDFILQRSDKTFAYQLAVVIDDYLMSVNQVVRGNDLLDSTPRQIYLQQLLNFSTPEYFHVPLLYGSDGHRLSKRQKALDIATMRQNGIKPEYIIGKLAYLGGIIDKFEPIKASDLIAYFDWDNIKNKSTLLNGQITISDNFFNF